MANFEKAFQYMAPHEWSQTKIFSDDPADPGGATQYGITQATLNQFLHGSPGFPTQVQDLTLDQAKQIYRTNYWIFDGINDDRVASKLFDMGVNMGPGKAAQGLQIALCALGRNVTVDGRLGPLTLAQANASVPDDLLAKLCDFQRAHYTQWIAQNPNRIKFSKGLFARADDLPEAS